MQTFPPSQLPPTGAGPVPILLSLLFLFSLPYPSTWGFSCLLGGLMSSASVQWVFCRSSSTCRCVSNVSVGRKVISASYSSAILPKAYLLNDARCSQEKNWKNLSDRENSASRGAKLLFCLVSFLHELPCKGKRGLHWKQQIAGSSSGHINTSQSLPVVL